MQATRKKATPALLALALATAAVLLVAGAVSRATAAPTAPAAIGWQIFKLPQPQPACSGVIFEVLYFDRVDCGVARFVVSNTDATSTVEVAYAGPDGTVFATQQAQYRGDLEPSLWQVPIRPTASWPTGLLSLRVSKVNGAGGSYGEAGSFYHNQLGGEVQVKAPASGAYAPGDPIPVEGSISKLDQVAGLAGATATPAPLATFKLRVVWADGTVRGPYGPFQADADGAFAATVPGAGTSGLTPTEANDFQAGASLDVVDATYSEAATGAWHADRAATAGYVFHGDPGRLVLEPSYVSDVGWVKPGESYPFRVVVRNFSQAAATGAAVTLAAPDGTSFTNATALAGSGSATVSAASVTWTIGDVAAGGANPVTKTLVVEAKADSTAQDTQIVWKDLSTAATLGYTMGGVARTETATTHGPKVIPPKDIYDTARYGDRPFPVVPVDFFDRKHDEDHTGQSLADQINSAGVDGSTFNLYQEMSYGQLFPQGTVPSAALATAGWNVDWKSDRYQDGRFSFTSPAPQGTCYGATTGEVQNTPIYPERARGGWYQLPGDTAYYGADRFGSALPGAIAGIGPLMDIDSACGPTGKAVYDAAHIADPEIDYSDYDTDKDGVVDFFMMVFVGRGGNGDSQLSEGYDNIWPHSSSLEFYYDDDATGLKGYISDDQLKDNEGRPLFYADTTYSTMTTQDTGIPVYVRVGPYNVNPETAIDRASVISHEYGHSLGLPDYYSLGDRETYGDWNLMATDKSQNMDVHGRQELGWVVPRVLAPGTELTVSDFVDSKTDTNRIDWVTPDGKPYTLTGAGVHNGQAYVAKLPARQIIDQAEIPSGTHAWWSKSGNDFGCPANKGHNVDIYLPELANVAAGTPVTLTFKSKWEIEWDFDYGFVMTSSDGGQTYTTHASAKGYTTPKEVNPTASVCQSQWGNGITGTSGSYAAGTQNVDRVTGDYPAGGFLDDEYALSGVAGKATVLRFSYATDPGVAKKGWFVDDVVVKAGDTVLYSSDFESEEERIFNGGCAEGGRVAAVCTAGWQYVDASAGSSADHAYYLEMRDRSSFDLEGKGENDRGPMQFLPGLYLQYTDETAGYGNTGESSTDSPNQSPLDSQPEAGSIAPNLHDAAWTANSGDDVFSDFGEGWTDNYEDPSSEDGFWHFRFDCLSFEVLSMSGNDLGPATGPGDLRGSVRFTTGAGCSPFDYGWLGNEPLPEPPTLALDSASYSVREVRRTASMVTVTVARSANLNGTASVQYATKNGTATAGSDYDAAAGTLVFADGEATKTITLTVRDDQRREGDETFFLALSSPSAGAQLGTPEQATVTILDDERRR